MDYRCAHELFYLKYRYKALPVEMFIGMYLFIG